MYLKRVHMVMPKEVMYMQYRLHFDYHVYYIGYYLHRCLKQMKFETDGTYSSISIQVGNVTSPKIEFNSFFEVIRVFIPFDFERYDNGSEYERNRYYIELYEKALTIAAEHRPIPLTELEECLKQLETDNFVCRWDFKNVSIKELGLKVKFHCQLTTYDFKLIADVYRKREQLPICSGTVIRTLPDSIEFDCISRKIIINNRSLRIQTKWNEEYFYLPLKCLLEGKLVVKECEPRDPDNKNDTESFYNIQRSFQYDNNDFKYHISASHQNHRTRNP